METVGPAVEAVGDKEGFSMNRGILTLFPLSLMFGAGLVLLGAVAVSRSLGESRIISYRTQSHAAFYKAQAGIEGAVEWLRRQGAAGGIPAVSDGICEAGGAMYAAHLTADDAVPPPGYDEPAVAIHCFDGRTRITPVPLGAEAAGYLSTIETFPPLVQAFRVVSVAQVGSVTRTITAVAQFENFSAYALFFGQVGTGPSPYFTQGNVIDGPFHTNGVLRVYIEDENGDHLDDDETPEFQGPVSTAFRIEEDGVLESGCDYACYSDEMFLGGSRIAGPWELPGSIDDLVTAAQGAGHAFEGAIRVELDSDGTIRIEDPAEEWLPTTLTLSDYPAGTVICAVDREDPPGSGTIVEEALVVFDKDGGGEVTSTLNGQLTVCSRGDVEIGDHIIYNERPQYFQESDDILGVVADRDVILRETAPGIDNGYPQGLELDGIYMARTGSVRMQNLDSESLPDKGALTIYGGSIEYMAGAKRRIDEAGDTHGYTGLYTFDPRTQQMIPPEFPSTNSVAIVSWEVN